MKRLLSNITVAAAIIFVPGTVVSQTQIDQPKYEFGFNAGFLVYQGDLTPEKLGSFKTQKLSFGIHAARIMSPTFSVRGSLLLGKLYGDDAKYDSPEYRQFRNFSFTSPVFELSGQLVWNFLGRNYKDRGFSPYVFAGAGLSKLKIKRDWSRVDLTYFNPEVSEMWAGLAADTTQKMPGVIPVIPLGVGVKYFFTPKLAVNAESSYRFLFTDYLDGFSKAANPNRKDSYLNYSVGLIYRTGKKNRLACPVVRY